MKYCALQQNINIVCFDFCLCSSYKSYFALRSHSVYILYSTREIINIANIAPNVIMKVNTGIGVKDRHILTTTPCFV